MNRQNIVIFASGSGTNAEQLVKHFHNTNDIRVAAIFSNNPQAYVLQRAKKLEVAAEVFGRAEFQDATFVEKLRAYQADYIILAGFLWKIPDYLIGLFPDKIVNIHPSLLPKYGGKGMYGSFVHEAVIQNREKQSGITIHLVNEKYDDGRILFQATCALSDADTPDSLAAKIHQLEHQYFPQVVEDYIRDKP